jgi:hypothetical protein
MLRLFTRRTNDVTYFTNDPAFELDGLRPGAAGWWLRGHGDPHDETAVRRVLTTSARSRIFGYDLVVAAPRMVSLLLALDPGHAPRVIEAHRRAVVAAVGYLERHGLVVRDRRFGGDRESGGRWESVVSFTHGVNHHGDPHLHDHVVFGARPADVDTVLDGWSLRAHLETADALYRTELRHRVGVTTRWDVWRSLAGVEHVVGVDEGYRALWGGHHDERGPKRLWSREDIAHHWATSRERWRAEVVVPAPARTTTLDEHCFAGAFEGRDRVARRDLVAAWANAAVFGMPAVEVERAVDLCYPAVTSGRGWREELIGVHQARAIALIRERGPRPLDATALRQWQDRTSTALTPETGLSLSR